jgi:ATP-binding cassette, subfamily F, member 3
MAETLLQLQNASLYFGARKIFSEASFSVNEGEHLGVVGPNGAGKTTLFRVLLGQEELESGQVIRSKKLRLAHLSQHDNWQPNETGSSFLSRTSALPLWELKSRSSELRLDPDTFERPILSWSGGYRMRFKLLSLLGQEPNLMLLDEPTNYLDLETVLVLEEFLQNYSGAFLLISHDREFLRRTTDHTLEVEAGEITKFNGHIDDYFEQKALLRSQLESAAKSQDSKRKDILDFVARFGAKATKARQAQSRLKLLEKMETIEVKPLLQASAIRIPRPSHVGKVVFELKQVSLGYGERPVLEKVEFSIERGDHLAVVGWNGAGKSTLLKALAGALQPMTGSLSLGHGVEISYFAQHVSESLQESDTIFDALERAAKASTTPQQILDLAGSLQFSGDDIRKTVAVLSGGEKSRVALGQVILKGSPCLVLDEPTNHLDFLTVESLVQALDSYEGTVILVSHDRGFVRRTAKKILEVDSGRVRVYPGSYDEYVWSVTSRKDEYQEGPKSSSEGAKGKRIAHTEASVSKSSEGNSSGGGERWLEKKEMEKELRQLRKRIEKTEQGIIGCKNAIERCNGELEALLDQGGSQFLALVDELARQTKEMESLESLWLNDSERLEFILNRLGLKSSS